MPFYFKQGKIPKTKDKMLHEVSGVDAKYNNFFHPRCKSTLLRDRFGVGPLFWRRAGTK